MDNPLPQTVNGWSGSLLNAGQDQSGLMYRRNRYYDPGTGRFTQTDLIGLFGGVNLYAFASGDPVNGRDPFGLCTWEEDIFCANGAPGDLGGYGSSSICSFQSGEETAMYDVWSRTNGTNGSGREEFYLLGANPNRPFTGYAVPERELIRDNSVPGVEKVWIPNIPSGATTIVHSHVLGEPPGATDRNAADWGYRVITVEPNRGYWVSDIRNWNGVSCH